jgi:adenine-specific DNA-methyltransferase
MPLRYMGSKRSIADRVRTLVSDLSPQGRVLDLFSGMGCVAESLADTAHIHTNDALSFTAVLARARFAPARRHLKASELIKRIRQRHRDLAEEILRSNRPQLREEQRALDHSHEALLGYMKDVHHVANSAAVAQLAVAASRLEGPEHYRLVTYYFAAGYFSLRQALYLDALRYAIDSANLARGDLDWALGAWLATAAALTNAPGHTAQYLKPNSINGYKRIKRSWQRSAWDTFQNELIDLKPVGSAAWRKENRVEVDDALHLLSRGKRRLNGVAAVYADPPYTKDQYSRYYHVYETLYRYDFPDSHGEGRVRGDRFVSPFSLKTKVAESFAELFSTVAALKLPLVLSYPSDGLLSRTGRSIPEIAADYMTIKTTECFSIDHSTMGASKGSTTKSAKENLYVCVPS